MAPVRMRDLAVAVVGVGALGDALVRLLGLAGVGRALLIDPDLAEASNLTRSLFLRAPDALNHPKTQVIRQAAGSLFPDTVFISHSVEIADVGLQDLQECDLLFGCLDSESARLELAYLATRVDRPVIDGGLSEPGAGYGRVSVFPSRRTACFGCGLRQSRRAELLRSFDASPHGCSERADEAARSSTPTQAALISALQLDLALESQSAEEAYALEMNVRRETSRHRLPQAGLCPFHGAPGRLIAPPSERATFGEILALAEADQILLDFPIALEAQCEACLQQAETPVRAALAEKSTCRNCGQRSVRPTRVLRTIGLEHADVRPRDLGLPARHLYTVKTSGSTRRP